MKKGQIAYCDAKVFTEYEVECFPHKNWELLHRPNLNGTNLRCLYREVLDTKMGVLVLGKTTIQTGAKHDAWEGVEDFEPAYLDADKHHSVWVVTKIYLNNDRFYKPFYALESDLYDTVSK